MAFTTQPSSFPSSLEVASLLLLVDGLSFTELNIHIHMLDREKAATSLNAFFFFLFGSLLKILQAIAIISYLKECYFIAKFKHLIALIFSLIDSAEFFHRTAATLCVQDTCCSGNESGLCIELDYL